MSVLDKTAVEPSKARFEELLEASRFATGCLVLPPR